MGGVGEVSLEVVEESFMPCASAGGHGLRPASVGRRRNLIVISVHTTTPRGVILKVNEQAKVWEPWGAVFLPTNSALAQLLVNALLQDDLDQRLIGYIPFVGQQPQLVQHGLRQAQRNRLRGGLQPR